MARTAKNHKFSATNKQQTNGFKGMRVSKTHVSRQTAQLSSATVTVKCRVTAILKLLCKTISLAERKDCHANPRQISGIKKSCVQCSNGKKNNRNALSPNAEGARNFNAARGSGERCKLPSGSGLSQATKRHLVHFWSENALSGKALAS